MKQIIDYYRVEEISIRKEIYFHDDGTKRENVVIRIKGNDDEFKIEVRSEDNKRLKIQRLKNISWNDPKDKIPF